MWHETRTGRRLPPHRLCARLVTLDLHSHICPTFCRVLQPCAGSTGIWHQIESVGLGSSCRCHVIPPSGRGEKKNECGIFDFTSIQPGETLAVRLSSKIFQNLGIEKENSASNVKLFYFPVYDYSNHCYYVQRQDFSAVLIQMSIFFSKHLILHTLKHTNYPFGCSFRIMEDKTSVLYAKKRCEEDILDVETHLLARR